MIFINISALITVIIITLLLLMLFKDKNNKLLEIGNLTTLFTVAIAIGYSIIELSRVSSYQALGENLHFSLILILYGAIINISIKLGLKLFVRRSQSA